MRTFKIIVSTFIAFGYVAAISGGFAQAQVHGSFNRTTSSYIEVTGKVLQRPGGGTNFAVAVDPITEQPLLTSTDIMDLGGGTGVEAIAGWQNRRGGNMELRTSLGNVQNNKSSITAPSGAQVTSPLFPQSVDSVGYDYTSNYFSIELCRRCNVKPGCTWIIGPRFISLKEEFNFSTETDAGFFLARSNNKFTTSNSLIGGQIGLEVSKPAFQNLYWTGFFRTGIYGNPVASKRTATTGGVDQLTFKSTKEIGSFVGECGLTVSYQIVPNVCSTFVGYEANWIDGIALAPTQALSVGEANVVTNNTVFWHAINFGFEFDF